MSQTVSHKMAVKLAQRMVQELSDAAQDDFIIMPEKTMKVAQGWIFFYNSRDFVETSDATAALAGNGPILVTHSGEVSETPSAVAWESEIQA